MSVQRQIPDTIRPPKFMIIKCLDSHTKTTVILIFLTIMILMGVVEYLSGWLLFNVS